MMVLKKNVDLQKFLSYFCVGAIATLVEWAGFYVFWNLFHIHYLVATACAFIISTFANWIVGRLWTFRHEKGNAVRELISVYGASIIGCGFNMGIMYLMVSKFGIYEFISKVMATAIVFIYNYAIRRFVIY